jgi:hypothetical protein
MAMAVPLSEEDIGMCQQAFAKFDPDGSGAIRTHELKQTLSCAPAAARAGGGLLDLSSARASNVCVHTLC